MGRRNCLRGLVGALLALSLELPLGARQSAPRITELASWLRLFDADILGNRAMLGRLGAAYLASHPHERNFPQLSRWLAAAGPTPVELHLMESIARDWAEHRIAVVEGWVLAQTEARLCAALHLMDGARA